MGTISEIALGEVPERVAQVLERHRVEAVESLLARGRQSFKRAYEEEIA